MASLDVDVIANVANGDVGLDGYVHAIVILNVVDLVSIFFAKFGVVDVLLVFYLLVVAVYVSIVLDAVFCPCCCGCRCSFAIPSVRCPDSVPSIRCMDLVVLDVGLP